MPVRAEGRECRRMTSDQGGGARAGSASGAAGTGGAGSRGRVAGATAATAVARVSAGAGRTTRTAVNGTVAEAGTGNPRDAGGSPRARRSRGHAAPPTPRGRRRQASTSPPGVGGHRVGACHRSSACGSLKRRRPDTLSGRRRQAVGDRPLSRQRPSNRQDIRWSPVTGALGAGRCRSSCRPIPSVTASLSVGSFTESE